MTRLASLGTEAALGTAAAVAYAAMVVGGPRAARVAWGAARWGAAAAAVAALVTVRADAVWLFDAVRIGTGSQVIKLVIAVGLLFSTFVVPRGAKERERCVGPVFRLMAAGGLALAASAADLFVLWGGLEIATMALVVATAIGGRWNDRATGVRGLVATWLSTSLLLLLGATILAALAGGTRYADLEVMLPGLALEPSVIAGLLLLGAGLLVRALRFVSIVGRL